MCPFDSSLSQDDGHLLRNRTFFLSFYLPYSNLESRNQHSLFVEAFIDYNTCFDGGETWDEVNLAKDRNFQYSWRLYN